MKNPRFSSLIFLSFCLFAGFVPAYAVLTVDQAVQKVMGMNDSAGLEALAQNRDNFKDWLGDSAATNRNARKIRCALGANLSTPREGLRFLYLKYPDEKKCLAAHPNLPEGMMLEISEGQNDEQKIALTKNPNLPIKAVRRLLKTRYKVRDAMQKALPNLVIYKQAEQKVQEKGLIQGLSEIQEDFLVQTLVKTMKLDYHQFLELYQQERLRLALLANPLYKEVLQQTQTRELRETQFHAIMAAPISAWHRAAGSNPAFPQAMMSQYLDNREFCYGLVNNPNTPAEIIAQIAERGTLPASVLGKHARATSSMKAAKAEVDEKAILRDRKRLVTGQWFLDQSAQLTLFENGTCHGYVIKQQVTGYEHKVISNRKNPDELSVWKVPKIKIISMVTYSGTWSMDSKSLVLIEGKGIESVQNPDSKIQPVRYHFWLRQDEKGNWTLESMKKEENPDLKKAQKEKERFDLLLDLAELNQK